MKPPQNSFPNAIDSQKNIRRKLPAKDKLKLLNLMTVILPAQKRFGTTEKELEAIIEVWARALGEFTIEQITAATWQYVKMRPDVPAVCQIENIIRYGHPDGEQKKPGIQRPTQTDILDEIEN